MRAAGRWTYVKLRRVLWCVPVAQVALRRGKLVGLNVDEKLSQLEPL